MSGIVFDGFCPSGPFSKIRLALVVAHKRVTAELRSRLFIRKLADGRVVLAVDIGRRENPIKTRFTMDNLKIHYPHFNLGSRQSYMGRFPLASNWRI